MKSRLISLIMLLMAAPAAFAGVAPDIDGFNSGKPAGDSIPPLHGNWVQQLWQSGFHINDPRINYPRFARFCVNVYNWGDRVFNSYDPNYVGFTGKNWKITLDGLGSSQSYGYLFERIPEVDSRVQIRSNFGYDLGIHLNFMAVSIGYTWNMNKLADYYDAPRSTFSFSFTCARFALELYNQKIQGNTYLYRFANYNGGRRVHIPLNNTRRNTLSVNGYYFLNHNRYSQAAPYRYTKFQLRSAGTWLVGARYSRQFVQIDFTDLPAEVLIYKPEKLSLLNQFHFHTFEGQAGYGFNAVLPHGWLYNITAMAGIGYRRSIQSQSRRAASELVSTTLDGKMAFTYNHRAFFASAVAKADLSLLFNSGYSFLISSECFQIIVGARF